MLDLYRVLSNVSNLKKALRRYKEKYPEAKPFEFYASTAESSDLVDELLEEIELEKNPLYKNE